MKENYTEVICIIDESGSMYTLTDDTIGGYNSFIEDQKNSEGQTAVTLVTFNNTIQTKYENIDVKDVSKLDKKDYVPNGMTALLDAVGLTIDKVGKRLAETPEENRPSKVIVMITTDGQENASKEYTRSRVKEMIEEQTNKYNWQFLFAGANIDSEKEAESIGINKAFATNYSHNSFGVSSVYRSLSAVSNLIKSNEVTMDSIEQCYKSTIK